VPNSQSQSDIIADPTRRALLSAIPAAAIGTAALAPAARALAASQAGKDDAELIRLGQELKAVWADYEAGVAPVEKIYLQGAEDLFDAAFKKVEAVVDRIEELTATTIEGLRVKALAVSWCHSGESILGEELSEQNTTDVRLAASIINDLLAL
jgi:hypothetical protein